jgi:hypothetical protein
MGETVLNLKERADVGRIQVGRFGGREFALDAMDVGRGKWAASMK